MPPSIAPLALPIGHPIAHQTLQRNDLPEPLFGRFRKEATPSPVSRNVILHGAHRRDLRAVADVKMVVDPHFGAQRQRDNSEELRLAALGKEEGLPVEQNVGKWYALWDLPV